MAKNNNLLMYAILGAVIIAVMLLTNKSIGRAGMGPLSGTVAYFPMENLVDQISGQSLTINGGVTSTAGISGNAYQFDGVTGYLSIPAPYGNLSNAVSLEAWIYPTAMQQGYVISKVNSYTLQLRPINTTNTGTLQGGIYYVNSSGSTVWTPLVNSQIINLNQWYHVVFTYDNINGAKLYINGTQSAAYPFTSTIAPSSTPLTIGNRADYATWGNRAFAGIIDEVRIYDRSLTSSEVTSLYNNPGIGVSGTNLLTNPSFDNNVTGWSTYFETTATGTRGRTIVAGEYSSAPGGYRIDCTTIGDNGGDIELYNTIPFSIQNGGIYTLTYKAKASTPFVMNNGIKLMMMSSPWSNYYSSRTTFQPSITTTWNTYTSTFTSLITASDARLTFYMGTNLPAGATFFIDDISLVKTGQTTPSPTCGNGICETGETSSNCANDCSTPSQTYTGWLFSNNACNSHTVTSSASPYNSSFLAIQSACTALIQANHYIGYELQNNVCVYKEVDSATNPYTATYKATLGECAALINCPSGTTLCGDNTCKTSCNSCPSGMTLCLDNTCKANCGCPTGTTLCSDNICKTSCGYTNMTGACNIAADCTYVKPVPNDCSIFFTPKNITITGTCENKACSYPLAESTCTSTELFIQTNKYIILVAIIFIVALVIMMRPPTYRRR